MPDEHGICTPPPENEIRQMQDFGPILCSIFLCFNNLYSLGGKHSGSPGPNSKQRRTEKNGRTGFRKACRIGTRTSIYLLQSGLVPCENTGKQIRCYKIAKSDVAAYLRRRLAEPAYYTPPSGWYKNYPNHKPPAFGLNGALVLTDATRRRVRRWYENLLARQPDVLNAHQIARITGYGARTVSRWCAEVRLKAFSHQHTYKVPKEWLLEFLTSEDYNSITRKSKAHYAIIAAVAPKPRKPRKKP